MSFFSEIGVRFFIFYLVEISPYEAMFGKEMASRQMKLLLMLSKTNAAQTVQELAGLQEDVGERLIAQSSTEIRTAKVFS